MGQAGPGRKGVGRDKRSQEEEEEEGGGGGEGVGGYPAEAASAPRARNPED